MPRETEPLLMTRLLRFLRSVIPADPTQLIFLCGALCLVASVHSSWLPVQLVAGLLDISWSKAQYSHVIQALLTVASYPIIAAYLAAYFLCLWTVKRPAAWVVAGVVFPAVFSLSLAIYAYYEFAAPPRSFLIPRATVITALQWIVENRWNFPAGVYVCSAGVALCLLFLSRLAFGLTTLPLSLGSRGPDHEEAIPWPATKIAIFFFVGPLIFLQIWGAIFLFELRNRFSHGLVMDIVWTGAEDVLKSALLVGVPLAVLGSLGWVLAKRSLTVPKFSALASGILVPMVAAGLTGATQFLTARVGWAAQPRGELGPPELGSFFAFRGLHQPTLLFAFIPAFAEEVVFRGVFLALLCKRYGLHRGVLFTGLLWAAIHFPGDSFYRLNAGGVLLHLVHRILFCVAMNYVLAWMALRWKSIIPAGLAHGVSNIVVYAGVNQWWGDAADLRTVFWAIFAYTLWHYWPIPEEAEAVIVDPQATVPEIEPQHAI
jgi:membrane protease YdiL (CAAX protease family)